MVFSKKDKDIQMLTLSLPSALAYHFFQKDRQMPQLMDPFGVQWGGEGQGQGLGHKGACELQ